MVYGKAAPAAVGAAFAYPLLLAGTGKEETQSPVIPVPPPATMRLLTMSAVRIDSAIIVAIIPNPPIGFNSRLSLVL